MIDNYKNIAVKNLSDHCGLASPSPQYGDIDLNSKATKLMVDFTKTSAKTANASTTVNDALELMRINQVRALMIVEQNGEFSGVVTAMDLMGIKPMVYANEAGIPRTEVLVKNIMIPKNNLKAFALDDIKKSTIGDVMQTLSTLQSQHILVVDGEDTEMKICGLFSASDFKRALGITIDSSQVAHTFSDLERVINEHKDVM